MTENTNTDTTPDRRRPASAGGFFVIASVVLLIATALVFVVWSALGGSGSENENGASVDVEDGPSPASTACGAATLEELLDAARDLERRKFKLVRAAARQELAHSIASLELDERYTAGLADEDARWLAAYGARLDALDEYATELLEWSWGEPIIQWRDAYNVRVIVDVTTYEFMDDDATARDPSLYATQRPLKQVRPRSFHATRIDEQWWLVDQPMSVAQTASVDGDGDRDAVGVGRIDWTRPATRQELQSLTSQIAVSAREVALHESDANEAYVASDPEVFTRAAVAAYEAGFAALAACERVRALAHLLSVDAPSATVQDWELIATTLTVLDGLSVPTDEPSSHPNTAPSVRAARVTYEEAQARADELIADGD